MSAGETLRDEAAALDAADPLAGYRECFHLPDGVVYLDGNSLGPLPKASVARLEQTVRGEWGTGLIRSWNACDRGGANWISAPQRVGAKIAPLIGAERHEVIACDSTSVNIFKLICAALHARPGRKTILSEPGNFPTDTYMIEGLEAQGLATRRLVERDGLEAALRGAGGGDVALLMLTHVHYRTGHLHDMERLTRAAHEAGALVLWDLAHTAGAMPVDLNALGVDYAVGCGYKYLNGGPGAPAFAFVAERHHDMLAQPLTGWMGHREPFAFSDDYAPGKGMDRLLAGTPPILGLAALEEGVELIARIGVDRLWTKSRALSRFFLACLDALGVDLEQVSPSDADRRGSQLSFRHEDAYAVCQALIARGVIGDFRAPDILRLGFAPAYLRFADMAAAARALGEVLESGEWRRPEFAERAAVT